MRFIFPKNYNFKNRLFGIIDYTTAIFNIIIFSVFIFLSNILFININAKIVFIIIFYFPLLLFSIFDIKNENIIYIMFYIIKYLLKPKLYLYK